MMNGATSSRTAFATAARNCPADHSPPDTCGRTVGEVGASAIDQTLLEMAQLPPQVRPYVCRPDRRQPLVKRLAGHARGGKSLPGHVPDGAHDLPRVHRRVAIVHNDLDDVLSEPHAVGRHGPGSVASQGVLPFVLLVLPFSFVFRHRPILCQGGGTPAGAGFRVKIDGTTLGGPPTCKPVVRRLQFTMSCTSEFLS